MSRTRIATVLTATAVVAVLSVAGTTPALAADSNSPRSTCNGEIWNPANNAGVNGRAAIDVEIYQANNAQSCPASPQGRTSTNREDPIIVHCEWSNGSQSWYYISDNGTKGWLAGSNTFTGGSGSIRGC